MIGECNERHSKNFTDDDRHHIVSKLTESMYDVTNALPQKFRLKILILLLISLNWSSVNIRSMCRFYCNDTMSSTLEWNPCTQ